MADAQERANPNEWAISSLRRACLQSIWLSSESTAVVNQPTHQGKALQSHMAKGTDKTRDENRGHLCKLPQVRMD